MSNIGGCHVRDWTSGASTGWRIGVDVGGTFTDLIAVSPDGRVEVHKVPSTPADPGVGVMNALHAAAAHERLELSEFLGLVSLFVHGSTIATNTVLEGKGARTGLLVTEGFRDFLEIRRGARENPWDHRTPYPPPLVPRRRRLPVAGRIDAAGVELQALDEGSARAAMSSLAAADIGALAICLINSPRNPEHEARIAALAAQVLGEGVYVCCSHRVASVMGEFERGSTAVLNAYVAPRTVGYLRSLEGALFKAGLKAPLLLMQNNGGSITVPEVAERPVNLLLSGPAAGVGGLRLYAESIGSDDLVSMEIGGTSCDVILMAGGRVAFTDHLDIAGYTYVAPSVEVHTVGAGGGTLARVDDAGLLYVGPDGAGARPGPACYGLGGDAPTVTDAQVVLGRLAEGAYAGGAVTIDAKLAHRALDARVGAPLGLDATEAAIGVIRLMEQKLLQAVQRLSTERGHDPRTFTLVAAGGAGPLHAVAVARALGCKRAFVPRLAGAFCAVGMLGTDVRHDHIRAFAVNLDPDGCEQVLEPLSDLEAEARARLLREGFGSTTASIRYGLDLRYQGQQWDISVPVDVPLDPSAIRRDFETEHMRLFGHIQPSGRIEVTRLRVTGTGSLPPMPRPKRELNHSSAKPRQHRKVWIDADHGWMDTAVFVGADLEPGHLVEGPAIIIERTATVLVGAGDRLDVNSAGDFMISLAEGSH